MAVELNSPGDKHAHALVDAGKVDKTSSWSFSAEDGNKLLGPNGDDWGEYSKWHLGEDTSAAEKTKARYKYPHGKGGKVYRSGVIAAKQRAAAQGAKAIEDAAGRLLEKIDGKKADDEKKALQEAATAERGRLAAILTAPEAKGREALSTHFAFATDMTAEAAIAALSASPVAAAPAAVDGLNKLDAAMRGANIPRLAPDGGDQGGRSELQLGAEAFAAAFAKR
jgi:hypothetical protein